MDNQYIRSDYVCLSGWTISKSTVQLLMYVVKIQVAHLQHTLASN